MAPIRSMFAFVGALALSACAISPGPETIGTRMCNFKRHHLTVEIAGDPRKEAQLQGEQSFAEALDEAYAPVSADKADRSGISSSMLFLSGGSQHGAFGAGFLNRWSELNGGKLPRFRVVTGISTGAILSTFAFLDEAAVTVENYSINEEEKVLRPFIRSGGGKIALTDAPVIARKGALGDLDPLRREMRRLLGESNRLGRIAAEGAAGRKLFVGAVDVDSGQAVIFDMTDMAARAATDPRPDLVRDCYVEAIMASSSVPLAALPVFLDNRMYIDGGARFGVFSDEIGTVIETKSKAMIEEYEALSARQQGALLPPKAPNVFILINGTLATEVRCGKLDKCKDGDLSRLVGAHQKWDLLDLAQRSASILINQGYRFSTSRIMTRREPPGFQPYVERIRSDVSEFPYEMKKPALGNGIKTCAQWEDMDDDLDDPIEFHPRYMHCLIAYGARQAKISNWESLE